MTALRRKLLIVGDGNTGKTCLLIAFTTDSFDDIYVPTIFENHEATINLGENEISLALWDSAGQEDFDRLRPLCYPDTDVILLSFAVNCRTSFDNVVLKWVPEIKKQCPGVPIVLVGNKKDLRYSPVDRQTPLTDTISPREGLRMASRIKAVTYVESSAKTKEGVNQVFITAAKAALKPKRNISKTRCNIQ